MYNDKQQQQQQQQKMKIKKRVVVGIRGQSIETI